MSKERKHTYLSVSIEDKVCTSRPDSGKTSAITHIKVKVHSNASSPLFRLFGKCVASIGGQTTCGALLPFIDHSNPSHKVNPPSSGTVFHGSIILRIFHFKYALLSHLPNCAVNMDSDRTQSMCFFWHFTQGVALSGTDHVIFILHGLIKNIS